jgi:hypothetical protein
LLQTADETAGQPAQCPECGGLSTIPTPAPGAAGEVPTAAEAGSPSTAQAGSPFGPGGQQPASPSDAENPYQSPGQYGPAMGYYVGPDPLAAGRVSGPATALIVTAILGMVGLALGIMANVAQVTLLQFPGHNRPLDFMPIMLPIGIALTIDAVHLALCVVMLLGAIKMKNLQNYGWAMASAIIAVIPCISPCCVLGLPFGIWALVVLSDAGVKAAFAQTQGFAKREALR